jgi:hypothetical protein
VTVAALDTAAKRNINVPVSDSLSVDACCGEAAPAATTIKKPLTLMCPASSDDDCDCCEATERDAGDQPRGGGAPVRASPTSRA